MDELLNISLKYRHLLFFCLSAHLEQEDITRYLVPYGSVDAYNFAFSPSGIRLWNRLPTETVNVQSLKSFKILIMDLCRKHGCFNQFKIHRTSHPTHFPITSYCTEEHVNDGLPFTVELQWLEYHWNHKNMFETGVVPAKEC